MEEPEVQSRAIQFQEQLEISLIEIQADREIHQAILYPCELQKTITAQMLRVLQAIQSVQKVQIIKG